MEDTVTILATGSGGSGGGVGIDTLLLILTSVGFTGIVTSIVASVVNRRKLKADTTEVISQAAGSLVERLEAENTRLAEDRDKAWAKVADLELLEDKRRAEMDQLREQIIEARDYERGLIQQVRDLGGNPPEPPKVILP